MNKDLLVKYARMFKEASLLDDLKFRKLCESKEAVSEILRVILRDDKLVVLKCYKQKTEEEPLFHGVILDCECKLKSGEIKRERNPATKNRRRRHVLSGYIVRNI